MLHRFSREELLIGEEGLRKLQAARVAVFGIGGVGGYVVEALAHSGIGALDLFDGDTVSLTNINRQIIALEGTVGRPKVEVAKERVLQINPQCRVEARNLFFTPENAGEVLEKLTPEELGVAQWVQKNNKQAGATTRTLPNSKWLFLAVRGTRGALGVVGVPIAGYPLPDAFEKNFMVGILSQCGLSMERWRLQAEKSGRQEL